MADAGETYIKCHREGKQNKDEEELEEARSIVSQTGHPVCSTRAISKHAGSHGTYTHIVETIMVGMMRRGTTSKSKRESNHAAGLYGNRISGRQLRYK